MASAASTKPSNTTEPADKSMKAWYYSAVAAVLEKSLDLHTDVPQPPTYPPSENEMLVEVLSMSMNPAEYKIPELELVGKFVIGTLASSGLDFCGRVCCNTSQVWLDARSAKPTK
jgi:NADPH:quinone reductase-like Zn-dependent oxidoreductase